MFLISGFGPAMPISCCVRTFPVMKLHINNILLMKILDQILLPLLAIHFCFHSLLRTLLFNPLARKSQLTGLKNACTKTQMPENWLSMHASI